MKRKALIQTAAFATATIGLLAGCNEKPATPAPAASAPIASASAANAAPAQQAGRLPGETVDYQELPINEKGEIATDTPVQPGPNYVMQDEGEYGYQPALSENEKKAGRATSALVMVRYLGEHNGIQSVMFVDGRQVAVMSCSSPCKFVKERDFYAGRLVKTSTLPVTDTSLIRAVLDDAFAGNLQVYGRKG